MKTWQIKRRAFTLVELLVVIAIIGILFVVLVSKVDFATDKAKTVGVQTDFRSFELAAHTVGVEQQGFVNDIDLLASQLNKNLDPKLKVAVTDDQIVTDAKDPWGTTYRITYSEPDSSRGQIVISSAGSDLKFDTDDDINVSIRFSITENGGQIEIENSTGSMDMGTPNAPSDPDDPDQGDDEPVQLAAGLYDANDNLIADWDDLVNTYGMNVEKDYTYSTYKTDTASPYYVLTNTPALTTGVKIKISDTVAKIGSYAFDSCRKLTSLDLGNGVRSIEYAAFNGCSGLTGTLVIPDSVTSIGGSAFHSCSGLTGLNLGSRVTSIGDIAFFACSELDNILVDDANTVYHDDNNCLIEINSKMLVLGCKNSVIPTDGSVTSIRKHAFRNCTGLTGALVIPDSVTIIGIQAFYGCSGLTSLDLGSGVTNVENYAFQNCSGLTSVELGSGVTNIGNGAFMGCSGLTDALVIPDSITNIGTQAFDGCSGLTSIIILSTEPPALDRYGLYNATALAVIYVPDESVDTYKSADGWSDYADLIKPISEKPAE